MSQNNERRQYRRLPKSYRLELAEFVFPLGSQPWLKATCEDVSAGGLSVIVPHYFKAGDKVQIRLHMARLNKFHPGFFKVFENDADQTLLAVAEVARVEERVPLTSYCLGLRFTNVYEDDWRALHGLIEDELHRQAQRQQA